ncbi:MAG: YopX family protein [Treponema sp.]|jgi:uncharacterized phage protein (TIGR01671 family)|nr:YopX family protein [Treponema sp.]
MRAIEFRGKREGTGRWVHGSYAEDSDEKHIINNTDLSQGQRGEWFKIDPDTVGEYTGLKDSNGVKIFEGDIVKSTSCMDETYVGEVSFRGGEWLLDLAGDDYYPLYRMQDYENGPTLEVIGNIHDNPELLKGGNEPSVPPGAS